MVYFEDKNWLIEWDEARKWIKINMIGFVQGEAHRNGSMKVVELLKQKKGTKLLTDTRQAKVLGLDEQKWVNEVWVPMIKAAGVRYTATVLPQNVIAQMSINAIAKTNKGVAELENAYFGTMEEAQNWLRTK
jgi:hypothetical protein